MPRRRGSLSEGLLEVTRLARELGLAVDHAEPIHEGANVLLRLDPAGVVARVAASTARVRGRAGARDAMARSLRVTDHLARMRVPVAGTTGRLPGGPHERAGLLVTFVEHVDHDASRPLDAQATASSLRAIHDTLRAHPLELPRLMPLEELPELLALLEHEELLTAGEHRALADRLARARGDIDALALPEQPLHGDASTGNVLRTPGGPLWNDFEDACTGPIEWDLACLVSTVRAFQRHRPGAEQTLAAYGAPDEDVLRPFISARVVQALAWGLVVAHGDAAKDTQVRELLASWLARGRSHQ